MDTDSDDNESTLDIEEAERSNVPVEQELNELSKEQNMDMDQLLSSVNFFKYFLIIIF